MASLKEVAAPEDAAAIALSNSLVMRSIRGGAQVWRAPAARSPALLPGAADAGAIRFATLKLVARVKVSTTSTARPPWRQTRG
jgi:hypothetical protein